ncbi:Putative ABC transporter [Acididesulfobacillus acetoxydans]|uniref:ABC transporter n=1 Tax=Acididesulfobacillus acetoxydans TaxID=1561005 RepID=A0A8S0Y3U8_9FIRM|nr:xylose ABC transporter ATP-binding protein [Acididesulfobacillus acetoxydans]CAA7602435.1 Putative ABC transporter [Acididesulfobacillus acetoxydans]CEJ08330.1 Xylose import ATP-binding protein XylG [Acididesulfobacillus acetoxydans]
MDRIQSDYVLEMVGIKKEFAGVKALEDVNLRVKWGEVHALVGENGAGKSTLMKILSGMYPAGEYEGRIFIRGAEQSFRSLKDSEKTGMAIIFQELTLVKQMTVSENIFLGNEIARRGIVDWNNTYELTKRALREVRLELNPSTKVKNLGIGQQQLVEIAKAISKNAEILILDEPTAALTETESANLLQIVLELKKKGVTCIYISHKLSEVLQIADTITVLRDGRTIATESAENMSENKIISLMVGRELTQRFPRREHVPGPVILKVKDLTVHDPDVPDKVALRGISFEARQGEILGVAGLMGAGRTELATSIFGTYGRGISGEIFLDGKKLKPGTPREAIKSGLGYVSEDRKNNGLVLMMDIKNNVMLASYESVTKLKVINQNEVIRHSNHFVSSLRIKTPTLEQRVQNLSGGNQQKVVLSKWLMTNPKVLIMDEPTRGIDVGAKYEIYHIMNDLVKQRVSIIMISSELPEILGMSDRIIVMHEGRIVAEMAASEATQEKIMSYATGGMKRG